MAKILVVANNKGGVGKTTTTNITAAYIGGICGKRVLLVDNDHQCNLTASVLDVEYGDHYLPIHPETGDRHDLSDIFLERPLAPYPTNLKNVSIIPNKPTNIALDQAGEDDIQKFVDFFDQEILHEMFDVIIIDTPPAKGAMTTAALRSGSHCIIPVVMEKKPVEGLFGMLQKIDEERNNQDHDRMIDLIGILPTKFDARMRLHKQYLTQLNDAETMAPISKLMIPSLLRQGDGVCSFVVKERAAIKEMELVGANPTTPFAMPKSSDVSKEWRALGKFIVDRMAL
ncbi:ParA family protein [uncultured Amphritea sp.]|uniref:ParA family protein n=1 Tax=uncultured Amphritea sp. TaxID=981605 RepID=UPI00262560A8|nr:ParA family protein [uncultured Amphritea sp.]